MWFEAIFCFFFFFKLRSSISCPFLSLTLFCWNTGISKNGKYSCLQFITIHTNKSVHLFARCHARPWLGLHQHLDGVGTLVSCWQGQCMGHSTCHLCWTMWHLMSRNASLAPSILAVLIFCSGSGAVQEGPGGCSSNGNPFLKKVKRLLPLIRGLFCFVELEACLLPHWAKCSEIPNRITNWNVKIGLEKNADSEIWEIILQVGWFLTSIDFNKINGGVIMWN